MKRNDSIIVVEIIMIAFLIGMLLWSFFSSRQTFRQKIKQIKKNYELLALQSLQSGGRSGAELERK